MWWVKSLGCSFSPLRVFTNPLNSEKYLKSTLHQENMYVASAGLVSEHDEIILADKSFQNIRLSPFICFIPRKNAAGILRHYIIILLLSTLRL